MNHKNYALKNKFLNCTVLAQIFNSQIKMTANFPINFYDYYYYVSGSLALAHKNHSNSVIITSLGMLITATHAHTTMMIPSLFTKLRGDTKTDDVIMST